MEMINETRNTLLAVCYVTRPGTPQSLKVKWRDTQHQVEELNGLKN